MAPPSYFFVLEVPPSLIYLVFYSPLRTCSTRDPTGEIQLQTWRVTRGSEAVHTESATKRVPNNAYDDHRSWSTSSLHQVERAHVNISITIPSWTIQSSNSQLPYSIYYDHVDESSFKTWDAAQLMGKLYNVHDRERYRISQTSSPPTHSLIRSWHEWYR